VAAEVDTVVVVVVVATIIALGIGTARAVGLWFLLASLPASNVVQAGMVAAVVAAVVVAVAAAVAMAAVAVLVIGSAQKGAALYSQAKWRVSSARNPSPKVPLTLAVVAVENAVEEDGVSRLLNCPSSVRRSQNHRSVTALMSSSTMQCMRTSNDHSSY
jgi:hypothetical protein